MNKNLYQPINGEIADIIDESPTIKSFVVVPEEEFHFAWRGRSAVYAILVTCRHG